MFNNISEMKTIINYYRYRVFNSLKITYNYSIWE